MRQSPPLAAPARVAEMHSDRIVRARQPRPRGWIDWKPKNDTRLLVKAATAMLETQREYLPLTIRQLYYLMAVEGFIGKTQRDYKRLCETLVKARRAGLIPFEALRDDGVSEQTPPLSFDAAVQARDFADGVLKNARYNPDSRQGTHQIVLCEAAGMVPQLARTARGYGVSVISAGGFDSVTAKYDLSRRITSDGRPAVVWHIGDHDPSGVHVFQSLSEDVCAFAEGHEAVFRRLAVTPAQIDALGLPSAPVKVTDNRAFSGERTVQAEAIPPEEMARILDASLASLWDAEIYAAGLALFDAELGR